MLELRPPTEGDLAPASALCIRSKAHWGYDAAFMAACAAELALTRQDLERDAVIVAADGTELVGVAQVSSGADGCFLEKLFVEPARMGRGVGRMLFDWSVGAARDFGARELIVEADPGAVPFYRAMGCTDAGTAPSGSVPGRRLPRLVHSLGNGGDPR